MVSIFILIFIRFKLFYDKSPYLSTVRSICNVSMLKFPVESIFTTKKIFFFGFFLKQLGFSLKTSQNSQLPLFALKAGYRTIPLTAERPKLFAHTAGDITQQIINDLQHALMDSKSETAPGSIKLLSIRGERHSGTGWLRKW